MPTENPFRLRPYLQNTWVFGLYGLVIALATGIGSSLKASLSTFEHVMLEPFSVYSFVFLSLGGIFVLGIINAFVLKTGREMRSSCFVTHLVVPIADAGLSAGSIVFGASCGLAIGSAVYSYVDPEMMKLAKIFGVLALYFFLLLYPLAWLARSLFDDTAHEHNVSAWFGGVYCIVTVVVMLFVSSNTFIKHVLYLAICAGVLALLYFPVKARLTTRSNGRSPAAAGSRR